MTNLTENDLRITRTEVQLNAPFVAAFAGTTHNSIRFVRGSNAKLVYQQIAIDDKGVAVTTRLFCDAGCINAALCAYLDDPDKAAVDGQYYDLEAAIAVSDGINTLIARPSEGKVL